MFILRLWSEPAGPLPPFSYPPGPRWALLGEARGSMEPGTSAAIWVLINTGTLEGLHLFRLMFGKHFHGGLHSVLEGDWDVWTPRRGLGSMRLGMTVVSLVASLQGREGGKHQQSAVRQVPGGVLQGCSPIPGRNHRTPAGGAGDAPAVRPPSGVGVGVGPFCSPSTGPAWNR